MIPKEAREKANIRPGDKVEVKVTKEGIVILPLKILQEGSLFL